MQEQYKQQFNRLKFIIGFTPVCFIIVDIKRYRLIQIRDNRCIALYPVSISSVGIGSQEGSNRTPEGVHRIAAKIGHGAPCGRVFRDRIDTGRTWTSADGSSEDLVLSRIMWLEGIEEGINRGPGIDTFGRYIYIHGTCREHLVGSPASHGCITMTNTDVIDLFRHVKEGSFVIID